MTYRRHDLDRQRGMKPELQSALVLSPIVLLVSIGGMFLHGDLKILPYIVRFVLFALAGYMAAARLHDRWRSRPSKRIFTEMPSTGMRSGFLTALIAWIGAGLFLLANEIIGLSLILTLVGGVLSAIIDLIAGGLLGLLGGSIYSRMNRPVRMRH